MNIHIGRVKVGASQTWKTSSSSKMSSPLAEKLVGRTTTFCTVPWSGKDEKKWDHVTEKERKKQTNHYQLRKKTHQSNYDIEKGKKCSVISRVWVQKEPWGDSLYRNTIYSIILIYEHEEVMVRLVLLPLLLPFYPKRPIKISVFCTSCCTDAQTEAVSFLMILK